MLEFCRSENSVQIRSIHEYLRLRIIGNLHGGMPHHAPDLAFELAHPGLAGVILNDAIQRLNRDIALIFFQAVSLALALDKVAQRNLKLLPGYNLADR
jgi:hypothetical protein